MRSVQKVLSIFEGFLIFICLTAEEKRLHDVSIIMLYLDKIFVNELPLLGFSFYGQWLTHPFLRLSEKWLTQC